MPAKVIVGMSGGVDSSVSALRLLDAGYEVSGLFMKNWDEDDGTEYCTAKEDLADAQAVCDLLGIELHTVNFASDYWDRVFEVFLTEYAAGRTPNPDILCNQEIKFRAFLDYAEALGADLIATGHYARNERRDGVHRLIKGDDPNKDQTYFIYTLGQSQLAKILFPVGDIHKDEVRQLAIKAGFGNARKRDSTGICFIGERKFKDFLMRYLPAQPGVIETPDGQKIGEHEGCAFHSKAKVRYRQEDQACHVEPLDEGKIIVRFDQAQRAVTPGQSVVFYQGTECLGGGVIETALWKGQSTGLIGNPLATALI